MSKQNDSKILVWKLANGSIRYLFAPTVSSSKSENDIINRINGFYFGPGGVLFIQDFSG